MIDLYQSVRNWCYPCVELEWPPQFMILQKKNTIKAGPQTNAPVCYDTRMPERIVINEPG